MANSLTTTELTDGERLWVWRKFRARLSQYQVTEFLDFGRDRVSKMENDSYPVSHRVNETIVPYSPTIQPALRDAEVIALARRRSGLTLREAAKLYGVSHVTMVKLEKEGDAVLMGWWAQRKPKK